MNIEHLTEEELKDLIFKKQLEWIKLCQDDFLIFATAVWQDFIIEKQRTQITGGTIRLLQMHFKI